jgi:hypothetical protein
VAQRREAADRAALEHERRARDLPAAVLGSDAVRVGHVHVGEEHLVEVVAARHLDQRAHLDARLREVDEQIDHALVLGGARLAAREQEAHVRVVRER